MNPKHYLVFDTETGGLCAGKSDILQLSYVILDADSWEKVKVVNHYFAWPDDESRVSYGAIQVNGLTKRFLAEQTLSDRKAAIEQFLADVRGCAGVVGHNISFDYRFILAEAKRAGIDGADKDWPRKFDTMKDTKTLCCLPSYSWWRNDSYKNPKLAELAVFLDIDFSDLHLHDSSADVELTALCFKKLCQRGHYVLE